MRVTVAHELETAALIPGLTVWLSLELEYAITIDRRARELEFDGLQKVKVLIDEISNEDEAGGLIALSDIDIACIIDTITPEWLYAHHAAEMAALEETALEEARDTLDDEAAHEADRAYTEWKETR